jgi:hypothetical protein
MKIYHLVTLIYRIIFPQGSQVRQPINNYPNVRFPSRETTGGQSLPLGAKFRMGLRLVFKIGPWAFKAAEFAAGAVGFALEKRSLQKWFLVDAPKNLSNEFQYISTQYALFTVVLPGVDACFLRFSPIFGGKKWSFSQKPML